MKKGKKRSTSHHHLSDWLVMSDRKTKDGHPLIQFPREETVIKRILMDNKNKKNAA